MRGAATFAHARHPSPHPLAPQKEREPKAYNFVASLPFCCLLAKRLNQFGTSKANGLRAEAWGS